MNLYLIERVDEQRGKWYDQNQGYVIAAPNPPQARALASEAHRDEDKHLWFSPERSTCKLIGVAHERDLPGIILTDCLNG